MKRGRWTLSPIENTSTAIMLDDGHVSFRANRATDGTITFDSSYVPEGVRKATDLMFTQMIGGHKNMRLTGACRERWHGQCGHGVYIQCRCHCHVRKA